MNEPGTASPRLSQPFRNPSLSFFTSVPHSLFFLFIMSFSSTLIVTVLSRIKSLCVVAKHTIADGKATGRTLRSDMVASNGLSILNSCGDHRGVW